MEKYKKFFNKTIVLANIGNRVAQNYR